MPDKLTLCRRLKKKTIGWLKHFGQLTEKLHWAGSIKNKEIDAL